MTVCDRCHSTSERWLPNLRTWICAICGWVTANQPTPPPAPPRTAADAHPVGRSHPLR